MKMYKKINNNQGQSGFTHTVTLSFIGILVLLCVAFAGYRVYKSNEIGNVKAATRCPTAPVKVDAAWYKYTNVYNSACSSTKNWGKTFTDQTVSTFDGPNKVSVTTSTALAGAISSIKVNNHEFVQSGGHGAASQWNVTRWGVNESASECWNPNQAGSTTDDRGAKTPYHNPSSSTLFSHKKVSSTTIEADSRLAYFVPFGETSSYDGCTRPKTGTIDDLLSPWWLKHKVTVAPYGLTNVIESQGLFSTNESAPTNNPSSLKFTHTTYVLNSYKNIAQDKTPMTTGNVNGTVRNQPAIFCDDEGYCIAEWVPKPTAQYACNYWREVSDSEVINTTYNGFGGAYVLVTACVAKADNPSYVPIKAGEQIKQRAYIVVGSKQRIIDTLAQLAAKVDK